MFLEKAIVVLELKAKTTKSLATFLLLKALERAKVSLPESIKTFLIKRILRARLDVRLFLSLVWLEALLIGIPKNLEIWGLRFQVWDLQDQIWRLRYLILPILKLLAYCQGFVEGTAFGFLAALAAYSFLQWMDLQRQKCSIYYLLYRCK